jgi:hypothetical protein
MDLINSFDMGYEGFSRANEETLEALSKALQAGSGVNAASFTGGRALTPESLDSVLVSVLHTTEEARLFQRLKKNPVKSVVHQWNYRSDVGPDYAGWTSEGGTAVSTDQTIARNYVTAKYLQTMRTVTLQAATSNMLEDAIAIEQEAGALWLVRNIEKAMFKGNSTNNTYEPDGLESQLTGQIQGSGATSGGLANAANIIDLRGADATSAIFENAINNGAKIIRQNFGVPTHCFTSISVMTDVQQLLRDRIRFGAGANLGSAIFNEYPTPFGKFELVDDVFNVEGTTPDVSAVSGIPGTTTALTMASPTINVDANSQFANTDAGNYFYQVSPLNQYGPGAAVNTTVAAAAVSGSNVSINITQQPVPAATAFKVYRSQKGATSATSGAGCLYMFTVALANLTGSNIIDENSYLPGTSSVYILNLNPVYNAIEWVQFLPMMKFDLYPTNAAVYPFLMLLFGALALKKPNQHIRIKNVSPSTLGWF